MQQALLGGPNSLLGMSRLALNPKKMHCVFVFLSDEANNYSSKRNPTLKYKSPVSVSALKLYFT